MLVQKKFKRLKVNAGFTFTPTAALCRKESEKTYRVLGSTGPVVGVPNRNGLVWVDSFQIKPWWKF